MCLFLIFYINEFTWDHLCLITLSTMFLRFIHIVMCINTSLFLWLDNIPFYGYTIFIYPLIHWWILELFPCFGLLWNGCHTFIYHLLESVLLLWGVELLAHRVILCLTCWETARVLSSALCNFTFSCQILLYMLGAIMNKNDPYILTERGGQWNISIIDKYVQCGEWSVLGQKEKVKQDKEDWECHRVVDDGL